MTTSPTDQFDKLDALEAELGAVQLQIMAILTQSGQAHQAIDAEYAPGLNPLYRRAQEVFDELQALCTAHRSELLPGDRKSAKRNTGTVGWRSTPRLVLHVAETELIARIRDLGQSASRKLVRRTVKRELNRDALLSNANRELVETIDGLEVQRGDDFYATPSGAFRMSSAKPYWPTLEGLSGQFALQTVMDTAE